MTTAQFDPATPIHLGLNPPPFMQAYVPEGSGTLEEFDEGTQTTLRRDDEQMALERREPDRRFWSPQPVKDRWSGLDVLACGPC